MRVTTMIAAAALLLGAGATAAAAQLVNQSVAADPTGSVEIHAVSGQIRVAGWSRNQVQVTGQLSGAGERVEVENEDGSVVVRVVYPRGRSSGGRELQLDVRVPQRSDVEVNVVSANATAEAIDGTLEVHSVSGGVRIANTRSREISAGSRSGTVEVTADADRVEANSVSGSVTVGGTVRDRVEAHSVSGAVRVTAAAGEVEAGSVSGDVEVASMRGRAEVNSVSGDLRVTGRGLSGSFQTVSGEITINGDLARGQDLELTTHSGTITLQMPAGASASVDFSTFSGDLDAQYPGARVTRQSRREARVVIGGGDARVTAQTFSGDVRLIRR